MANLLFVIELLIFIRTCVTNSKLVCIALGAGSREWSISLPNCEEVLAVAASEKLVAIATDARYLRLFSIMGTQREVLSISGPVITVAGHSDSIMVAYHSASPTGDDQHISLLLVQAIGLSLRCREVPLPLSPGTKLRWLGYSDRGSPVFCDSMGMVRMMNLKSNFWMPVCDTSEHVSIKFFFNFFKPNNNEKFVFNAEKERIRHILCYRCIRSESNCTCNSLPWYIVSANKSKTNDFRITNAHTNVRFRYRKNTIGRITFTLC